MVNVITNDIGIGIDKYRYSGALKLKWCKISWIKQLKHMHSGHNVCNI